MSEKKVVKNDSIVKVHYIGKLNDGVIFDSSYQRNEPLEFKLGDGQILQMFEESIIGLEVNGKTSVEIPPEKAYGDYNEKMSQNVELANLPDNLEVGMQLSGATPDGQSFMCKVAEINKEEGVAVIDANHPLAGKTLHFDIEVLGIE